MSLLHHSIYGKLIEPLAKVRGFSKMVMGKKQYLFSGIPYAKPPTGSRRFVLITYSYSSFFRRKNCDCFPFDWFTTDFGNQRRFPHGRVFWMGPKCQTLVFRLYPWIPCISINLDDSKTPCPVQCLSILRLMIGIKIGEIWVLPWFLWWGDVEPKHSIVRGKA